MVTWQMLQAPLLEFCSVGLLSHPSKPNLIFNIYVCMYLSQMSMLQYPSNVCEDGWVSQWIKIKQILIHPKFASYTADTKNMMYNVAMIQLEKRIRQPSLTGHARITDVIRPACLPQPGQINQISLVNQWHSNSRNWTKFSSKIMRREDCIRHNTYALKNQYGITLKRFDRK